MRIYKAMGYGLRGLTTDDKSNIADPRVNSDSILLDYDREGEATVRAFVRSTLSEDKTEADLDRVLAGWSYGQMDPESTDPFDCVQHFFETPLEDTMLIRPVGNKSWTRRADLMDIYADQAAGYDGESHVESLGGIYPYSNKYMDAETFAPVEWNAIGDWIRAVNDKREKNLESEASHALKELGWGDIGAEGLKKRLVPAVPEEIIQLAEFGKLFTQPEYVYDLRPMIVTVWR